MRIFEREFQDECPPKPQKEKPVKPFDEWDHEAEQLKIQIERERERARERAHRLQDYRRLVL